MIRVLLVDDEQPARDRLRQLLLSIEDIEVIGEAEDGEQAVALTAALDEDACVLRDHRHCKGVVAGEGIPHRVRVLLPEASAALDVGEEKRNRSRRRRQT